MKKEILNLKLELFKSVVKDYQVSKKGNHWGYLGNKDIVKTNYVVGIYNVTKNSINKLFQTQEYSKNNSTILLMTPKGKLFIKQPPQKSFKAVTLNTCTTELTKLFLFGRKSEWLCVYPHLVRIKFLHSFKSLNEVKLFLNYQFISDYEFGLMVSESFLPYVIYSKQLTHEDRVSIVHHKQNSTLMDAINMSVQMGESISIPLSKEKLKTWHDDLVSKKNSEKASNYSDKQIQYESWLFDYWDSKDIKYKVLDSPRKLFIQGCKQNHCLASYANQMTRHIYITFIHNDVEYDMQIHDTNGLVQFYGYRNTRPPQELSDLVKFDKLQDSYFKILNPEDANVPVKQNTWQLENTLF